jgi:hypothetical protein
MFYLFFKQGQYTKEINDLKLKLQKIEHENIIIKQDVSLEYFLNLSWDDLW